MIRDNYRRNPAAIDPAFIDFGFAENRKASNTAISLDSAIGKTEIVKKVNMGLIQIPVSHIVGYVSGDCDWADDTAYLRCCEYLGDFYIYGTPTQVSFIMNSGSFVLNARVMRLIPAYCDEKRIQAYYEFLNYYPLTEMYQVQFTQPGYFAIFQNALGHDADYVWTNTDRCNFLMKWYVVESAFHNSFDQKMNISAADALVVLLENHTISQITSMPSWILMKTFQASWKKLHMLDVQMAAKAESAFPAEEVLQTAS